MPFDEHNNNSSPFREKLEDSSIHERLQELPSHPTKVIRSDESESGGPYEEHIFGEKEFYTLEETLETLERGKTVFNTLQKEPYGITVANFDIVIGHDEKGKQTAHFVIDKIEGQNLSETTHLPQEAAAKLDHLYSSLTLYYRDTLEQQGDMWNDFKMDQFVFGNKIGESTQEVYLVDVEPYIVDLSKKEDSGLNLASSRLLDVARSVIQTEKKFDPPITLDKARATLNDVTKELIEQHHKGHKETQLLATIRGILKQ